MKVRKEKCQQLNESSSFLVIQKSCNLGEINGERNRYQIELRGIFESLKKTGGTYANILHVADNEILLVDTGCPIEEAILVVWDEVGPVFLQG